MAKPWRGLLLEINDELREEDLRSLKFLCTEFLKRKELSSVKNGCDLFERLETKGLLFPNDMNLLHRMLQTIGRIDLCNLLAKEVHIQVDSELECRNQPSFYKLLFNISEEMGQDDVSSLRFLNKVPANKRIECGFDLFSYLIDQGFLGPSNLDSLIRNLEQIGRRDLVRKLEEAKVKFSEQDESDKESLASSISSSSFGDQEACQKSPVADLVTTPNQTTPKWVLSEEDDLFNKAQTLSLSAAGEENPSGHRSGVSTLPEQVTSENTDFKLASEHPGNKRSENLTIHTHPSGSQDPMAQAGASNSLPRYKMDAKPRGFCLVIDNHDFTYNPRDDEAKKLTPRRGSEKDTENIKNCFEALHFDVRIENNLSDHEMVETFNKYAQDRESNNKHNCFVAFILSHGGAERDHGQPFLYGSNGRKIILDKIIHLFRPDCCPSLRGKPKLFFLACCLGGTYSKAVPPSPVGLQDTDSGIHTDSAVSEEDEVTKSFISNDQDFLIGYSTVKGNVSFRDTKQGTWYITALTEVFTEYHERESVHHMLLEVNNRVAKNRYQRKEEGGKTRSYAQVPAPQHTLTKQLWF